ncbi:MAG TPA: hypothetical protein DCZ94_09970 [Lentisphaeria bacterium]|nr:MAG: hypothetical protein A2X48_08385 [Lentisphaerae bacterium GWF2_49_21]HBC87270.1 hypothetical protein [Lentisphaeria bacterium]
MKKLFLMMAVIFCGALLVSADAGDKQDAPTLKPLDEWTFLQIGFFPGIPQGTNYSNVYGIKIGVPMVSGYGRVRGIEPSILLSGTDYVYGVQATLLGVNRAKRVYGLQATSLVNISEEVIGFELSQVNIANEIKGFQASVVNVTGKVAGFQAGAVNVANKVDGFQASAVNIVGEELKGGQLGVFNYSKKSGCQFGLVNIIEDGWIPFMIIFNIKF